MLITKHGIVAELDSLANSSSVVALVYFPGLYTLYAFAGYDELDPLMKASFDEIYQRCSRNDSITLHLILNTLFRVPSSFYADKIADLRSAVLATGSIKRLTRILDDLESRIEATPTDK